MLSMRLIELSDVPPGTVREARVNDRTFAVCNVDGQVFVVSGDCPHRDGPLGHGALHGYTLVCPWHAWEFDVRTGESDAGPGCRIAGYPTRIEQGAVHIDPD
jgi:nitrite reductase/ring-hydroxylating ferredoxin subunit